MNKYIVPNIHIVEGMRFSPGKSREYDTCTTKAERKGGEKLSLLFHGKWAEIAALHLNEGQIINALTVLTNKG